MRDLVYPPVILAARAVFAGLGLRITIEGAHHVPRTGGAVIASNHVSYLDFTFVGYGTREAGRLVRFMAKDAVFKHRVSGPLMRGMHHIPVDRAAGSAAFREAMAALKAGELVGVFPEATISRSFELKEFKAGAARMAQAAGVPLVPTVVWGGQRIYTKGRPRDFTHRGKALTIAFGEPLTPSKRDKGDEVTAELHRRMAELLDRVRTEYPDRPAGDADRWWLPASMGGTAPTLTEATALDEAEAAARAARTGVADAE
jgi:1-acyl-sn-glycerol-3-phosphate acyltransferase